MDRPWLAHYESSVPPTLTYPARTLPQMLAESVARYPQRLALKLVLGDAGADALGAELTYRELGDQVARLAVGLAGLGVQPGDRVGLVLPNLPQFVAAYYAILTMGAVVVSVNPTFTPRELAQQFADAGVETVVTLSGFYGKLAAVRAQTPLRRIILTELTDPVPLAQQPVVAAAALREGLSAEIPLTEGVYRYAALLAATGAPPAVEIKPDALALLQYTGGTTGIPKGAMLSHANLVTNAIQMTRWVHVLEPGRENVLAAIPLFHIYGMTVAMNLALFSGQTLVLLPNPRPIERVLAVTQRERISMLPGVPTMYIGMIHHPNVGAYDLRSVKACISGSAPLPMEVQLRFGELTGGRLVEGYGLTEASPVTHVNPVCGLRKNGAIGLPISDVEALIVDPQTLAPKGLGEEGELWVRGPQVMQGYWGQPAETRRQITPDGWLRTGDLARMDADGYFYIVDRLKDLIIVSGFNVAPREVEEVLFQHPAVREAVAIGVPHPYRGEVVKAFVALQPQTEVTAEALIAHCAANLAPYKVPQAIEFRAELPKSTVGKVLRRLLAAEAHNG